ncbi:FAD-binding and (Fe-S)-binding domain-containing protein (plasmid) [Haloferax prahovense]|uniref:FAD-binding and (Fe-S)-binding domain-containing protein n=1 Tax=Haloferax prahovense TaxID=381852 RepID=UPI003C7483A6
MSEASLPKPLAALDGEVDFGDRTRTLYATDASIYREKPAGVVFPRSTADVRRTVTYARDAGVSITARGAGSSLTGNAIGSGIVLDCERHLDAIADVDPDACTVTVQPGVVLEDLNDYLEQYGLYFPPDPSTSSTCTIGGMVANDAAGPHSVQHGTTSDNVRRVECVLADGSVETFERVAGDELDCQTDRSDRVGEIYRTVRNLRVEHAAEIEAQYPDVDRNSSGYDLERAAAADGTWVDLSQLLTGSEGTLGVVTEVTLALTTRPEVRAGALVFYDDVVTAAAAVDDVLDADPSVLELIDATVLGYARDAWGIDLVPADAGAALLLEVEATTDTQDDRLEAVIDAACTEAMVGVERAFGKDAQAELWQIRKASNPLLNRHPGDEQALSFIEDAAVPPSELPTYLERVGDILGSHNLEASVFGHAGQGVLHVKPFLDLRTEADRDRLEAVSEAVHNLVIELEGCVSGEHGDGRLRSAHLESMYGPTVHDAFIEIKRAFDPDDVFNPGNVIPASDGRLAGVTENLRYDGYDPEAVETALDFGAEGGFDAVVERCNGCSKCRSTGDGVMCPSYRAVEEEGTTTRGRANMLREAIAGDLGEEALTSKWFQEDVLDRCLACKACETECPTGVDMAKLKTEAKHRKHERDGVPLRARLFGNVRTLNRLGSMLAPLANRLAAARPGRVLLDRVLGIDRRRSLPAFAAESLEEWFATHEPGPRAGDRGHVALLADCYTNYNHPAVGRATVRLLEASGYRVSLPDTACCGRPALSQGLVDTARENARENVETLAGLVDDGVPVVSVEPSCVSAFDEYGDLLDDPRGLPDATYTVAEFLDAEGVTPPFDRAAGAPTVAVHGHCHAKARDRDDAPLALLRAAGYDPVQVEATCCGMAGAFGYKTEHYDVSTSLGADLVAKIDAVDADFVAATGASCTQQLTDHNVDVEHPIVLLEDRLGG